MITATVDPESIRRFKHLIDEMQRTTGAEMEKVVRNAGRDLVFAAIRYTPLSKKYERMAIPGKGYLVITRHRHTGKVVKFVGSRQQAENYSRFGIRYLVRNRGFAKAGWIAALPALDIAPRKSYPGRDKSEAAKYSRVIKTKGRGECGLMIKNLVPFIVDLDKGRNKDGVPLHILERSIREVNAKWETRLNRMAAKVAKRMIGYV